MKQRLKSRCTWMNALDFENNSRRSSSQKILSRTLKSLRSSSKNSSRETWLFNRCKSKTRKSLACFRRKTKKTDSWLSLCRKWSEGCERHKRKSKQSENRKRIAKKTRGKSTKCERIYLRLGSRLNNLQLKLKSWRRALQISVKPQHVCNPPIPPVSPNSNHWATLSTKLKSDDFSNRLTILPKQTRTKTRKFKRPKPIFKRKSKN